MQIQFMGPEDPMEEGMATKSSILTWRISEREEPGRLLSVYCVAKELNVTEAIWHSRAYFSAHKQSCFI